MAKAEAEEVEASKPAISVVIPVFNGSATLRAVVEQTAAVLKPLTSAHEFILVNDGSADRSWDEIEILARERDDVRGIRLMRNYGQHNALLCGIREARFEWIATLDDDLQHPPEALPRLMEKLAGGLDVVYCLPERETHGFLRGLASRCIRLFLRITTGNKAMGRASAYRLFRRDLREAFEGFRSSFVLVDVLFNWGTDKFGHVVHPHDLRPVGKSNYSFFQLLGVAMNLFTSFSTLPLKLVAIMGFFFTLLGLVLMGYVVGSYLFYGGSIPGFPFLASVLCIFSGAQLFSLGVFGEYLARIFKNSMGKPPFAVRQRIGGGAS